MLELIPLFILIAIGAFVYSEILTDGEMILDKFKGFLYQRIGKYPWLFKPIIDCSYCVSGQWAFWYYIYLTVFKNEADYSVDKHILITLFTIFIVAIIKKLKIYG